MRVMYLLISIFFVGCYVVNPKGYKDFNITNNKIKVNNSLYKHIVVIDERTDTNSLGHLFLEARLGDNNDRLFEIKNKISFDKQIKELFNNAVNEAAISDTIVLQVRNVFFNELFVNFNWASYFHLRFNTYRKNNNIYYPISTVDTTINFNLVFRYNKRRLFRKARKVFKQKILSTFSIYSDTNVAYNEYEISRIDSIEKSAMPLYTNPTLNDGIYLNYESFKNQQPDNFFYVNISEKGEIKELYEKDLEANLKIIKVKKIYALVWNGRPFISNLKKLTPLTKMGNNYFFTDKIFLSTNDAEFQHGFNVASKKVINFINLKSLFSSNKRIILVQLDHLNGNFINAESVKPKQLTCVVKYIFKVIIFYSNSQFSKFHKTKNDTIDIVGLTSFKPNTPLTIVLHHSERTKDEIVANHTYNQQQIEWFKEGAALNIIRKQIVVQYSLNKIFILNTKCVNFGAAQNIIRKQILA